LPLYKISEESWIKYSVPHLNMISENQLWTNR
jgi:hypothetical protein